MRERGGGERWMWETHRVQAASPLGVPKRFEGGSDRGRIWVRKGVGHGSDMGSDMSEKGSDMVKKGVGYGSFV